MTLILLLLMVVVAGLLSLRRWRRTSVALFILAFVSFVVVGSGVPAKLLSSSLQDGYETRAANWGTHNAIVLLGAGSERTDRGTEPGVFSYGRLTKALELYRACKAHAADCRILSSGGDTHGYGVSEAELYSSRLQAMGVPRADSLVEKRSMNTWQNAQFTAEIFSRQKFDRVVLVTSGIHMPRSLLYFAHFGIRAQPVRGDYAPATVSVFPNAFNFLLTDLALHEYAGVLRYHVYNLLGWNVRPTQPGAL